MNLPQTIRSQYLAALAMLKHAIEACPDAMWDDPQDRGRFWQVAYHALFYAHFYLQETEQAFEPWAKHTDRAHRFGDEAPAQALYTRDDLLEYLALCQQQVETQVPRLNLDAPSGFYWLSFDKLELQFYNIRHIQQHTGELMERLGARAAVGEQWVDWVGKHD